MFEMFEVGGCVRDEFMGLQSKDVDFVVLAPSFEAMRDELVAQGFKIWQERPEFVTIRAGVPDGNPLRERTRDADFVLARKDSPTGDGRRPDSVEPGTLEDDLARRDFRFNAIAKNAVTGEIIDPHEGRADIMDRSLQFVGDPFARIREDGLRVLRGFRFMITKGVAPKGDTFAALTSATATEMLQGRAVAAERIEDELDKMIKASLEDTIRLLDRVMPHEMLEVCQAKLAALPGPRLAMAVTTSILVSRGK